jgi:hypothetical protein
MNGTLKKELSKKGEIEMFTHPPPCLPACLPDDDEHVLMGCLPHCQQRITSFSHIADMHCHHMTHNVNLNFAKQSSRKKDTYCNYEMDIPKTHGIQIPHHPRKQTLQSTKE